MGWGFSAQPFSLPLPRAVDTHLGVLAEEKNKVRPRVGNKALGGGFNFEKKTIGSWRGCGMAARRQ